MVSATSTTIQLTAWSFAENDEALEPVKKLRALAAAHKKHSVCIATKGLCVHTHTYEANMFFVVYTMTASLKSGDISSVRDHKEINVQTKHTPLHAHHTPTRGLTTGPCWRRTGSGLLVGWVPWWVMEWWSVRSEVRCDQSEEKEGVSLLWLISGGGGGCATTKGQTSYVISCIHFLYSWKHYSQ